MEKYRIEQVSSHFFQQALALVENVFMEFEAPDYSEQGVEEFRKFINPERIQKEIDSSALRLWGCFHERQIVGVLGVESKGHICLLFVAKEFHRQGIAKAMLEKGLAPLREKNLPQVTVNSSPYAVPAYQRMGFITTQPEQCFNGVRYIPMALSFG